MNAQAQALVQHLTARGVRLFAERGRLIAEPNSLLSDADRSALRALKPQLLAILPKPRTVTPNSRHPLITPEVRAKIDRQARACRRCGYHVYDAERICCPQCDQELPQPAPANPEAEGDRLARAEQQEAQIDRLASADGWKLPPVKGHPAYSIIGACQRYGVALRIDPDNGNLVVGKPGAKADEPSQPWLSLLMAIEAHVEEVAVLVEAGWTLTAGFPKDAAA